MITVGDHPDGSILNVRAQPGARCNAVLGEREGTLRVAVSSPPDKGKANAAIVRYLAEILRCKMSQISLISGGTSRQKRLLITGLRPDELRLRVERLLADIEPNEA
jgi:uncharacterized protein (TIGR00251 family)